MGPASLHSTSLDGHDILSVPHRTLNVGNREFGSFEGWGRSKRSVCCLPVLSPLSKAALLWVGFTSVWDLTITAFFVPIDVGFSMEGDNWLTPLAIMSFAFNFVYIADVLFSFHIGFVVRSPLRAVVITGGRATAWFYIKHGTFWVDILAILPSLINGIVVASTDEGSLKGYLHIALLLRLLRLLRVWRVLAFHLATTTLLILKTAYTLLLVLNLLGCMWWFVARAEGLENSWAAGVEGKNYDLLTASDVTRWLTSVYFVTTTLTTTGYGDVVAHTQVEELVVVGYMLIAASFHGYLIGVVTQILASRGSQARTAETVRAKLSEVEHWMTVRELPTKLQRAIRNFYTDVWASAADPDDHEFFVDLPPPLRHKVATNLQSEALDKVLVTGPWAKVAGQGQAPAQMHELLSQNSSPERLLAGNRLFSRGDDADCFFLLEEGDMTAITRGGVRVDFSAPALIGTGALFAPHVDPLSKRLQTIQALTNCRVWRVECGPLLLLLEAHRPGLLLLLLGRYRQKVGELMREWRAAAALMTEWQLQLLQLFEGIDAELEALEPRFQELSEMSAAAATKHAADHPIASGAEALLPSNKEASRLKVWVHRWRARHAAAPTSKEHEDSWGGGAVNKAAASIQPTSTTMRFEEELVDGDGTSEDTPLPAAVAAVMAQPPPAAAAAAAEVAAAPPAAVTATPVAAPAAAAAVAAAAEVLGQGDVESQLAQAALVHDNPAISAAAASIMVDENAAKAVVLRRVARGYALCDVMLAPPDSLPST